MNRIILGEIGPPTERLQKAMEPSTSRAHN